MSIPDRFANLDPGLLGPWVGGFAMTAGTAFPQVTRAIHCGGGGGSITATMLDGSSVTLTIATGQFLNMRVQALTAAVATGLVGFY